MQLNFTVNALLYDTSEAYYKCTFTDMSCSLKILFPKGNVAVLTSPGPEQVRLQFSRLYKKDATMENFYSVGSYPLRFALVSVAPGYR